MLRRGTPKGIAEDGDSRSGFGADSASSDAIPFDPGARTLALTECPSAALSGINPSESERVSNSERKPDTILSTSAGRLISPLAIPGNSFNNISRTGQV